MNLDWDLPTIGPPPDASTAREPLDVELRLDLGS
jgi:hypothetical protein